MTGSLGLPLDESAAGLARLVASKRRAFERVGGWVVSTPEPAAKLVLATLSAHQGAHAVELGRLLPRTRDHDPEAVVTAAPLVEEVLALDGPRSRDAVSGPRLLAVRAALAALAESAEALAARMSVVGDGPTVRTLRTVARSDRDDLLRLDARGER